MANTGFQTVYNNIGLEPKHTAWSYALVIWNLGEMVRVKWNETRRIGAIFCIILSRAGLSCFCCLVLAHHTGATWHSSLAASGRENTVQDCCSDIWLCPRRWSRLFQASSPSTLWSVMSVTPFCQPRRLVRFAGKHVHRPTKFFYRGSCCLERTSTWPTLTAHQSPTVLIQAENSSVPTSLQDCVILLRTICWRVKLCNCNCNCNCTSSVSWLRFLEMRPETPS